MKVTLLKAELDWIKANNNQDIDAVFTNPHNVNLYDVIFRNDITASDIWMMAREYQLSKYK